MEEHVKDSSRFYEDEDGFIHVPVRVRYADTDKMGIVYYGTYPVYFEIGRSEYMRQKGFSYRRLEEMGYYLVVVRMELTYYNSAEYDDHLIVKTKISEWKSRGLTFQYIICRDNDIIVQGKTVHICTNSHKKPVMIPKQLQEILRNAD
ncbi:MAG TPA: thioesterase family protein [Syntrophorhabdaceae bacterium]|nr:thioesterase family protein [Syntrophorhabdaceae bacterium]